MFGIVGWVIVGILLVVLLMFIKVRHMKHRFLAIVLILLLVFFYFTATSLFSGKDIDFKTFDGWMGAGKIYFSWLWHAGTNVRVIAGNAIKMDWVGNTTVINATNESA